MRSRVFAGCARGARGLSLTAGLLASATVSGSAQATNPLPRRLFPVALHGYHGYIDSTGRTIIPLRFDEARPFAEGLAAVQIRGLYGYIDTLGTIVIPPRFEYGADFSEGVAWVQDGSTRWYIDRTGRVVIGPKFDPGGAGDFSHGLASVKIGGVAGYMDHTGTMMIRSPAGSYSPDFADGLATVEVEGKWGFIDTTGTVVIEPRFPIGWNRLLSPSFHEGFAAVQVDRTWGYIDKTGRVVIPARFDEAHSFTDGLAPVRVGDQWGFIDTTGAFVIAPQYVKTWGFSEGLAAVQIGDQWGYIDRTGRLVIAAQFDAEDRFGFMAGFGGGIARARRGDEYGYIDRTGTFVWSSLRADTAALAGEGSIIERVAALVERAEAAEAGAPLDLTQEQLLGQLAKAATGLAAHLDSQPRDTRALILAARVGRLRGVATPVIATRDHVPSLDSFVVEHAPLHTYLGRALALEPGNAAAHYWKGRLYGLSFGWTDVLYGVYGPPDSVAPHLQAYADSAVTFGRRAVELAPEQVPYREALARYLAFGGRPDEAADVLRDVAGGQHPISLLLGDWRLLPIPPDAAPWPMQARLLARQIPWSDAQLRVRVYVLPMPASQVEALFRERWPSLRFFELGSEERARGVRTWGQFLRLRGATLEPARRRRDVESSQDLDTLSDGLLISLVEVTGAPPDARSQLPIAVGDVFSTLTVVNVRRIR